MKVCASCKKRLKLDKFYTKKDKIDYYCKPCRNEKNMQSHNNPKKRNGRKCQVTGCKNGHYAKDFCKLHYTRNAAKSKPKLPFVTFGLRPDKVPYTYGITYRELREMAKFGCNICQSFENLQVDHDHSCCNVQKRICGTCVRGIVCASCNNLLKSYENKTLRTVNPKYKGIVDYIEKYESER